MFAYNYGFPNWTGISVPCSFSFFFPFSKLPLRGFSFFIFHVHQKYQLISYNLYFQAAQRTNYRNGDRVYNDSHTYEAQQCVKLNLRNIGSSGRLEILKKMSTFQSYNS